MKQFALVASFLLFLFHTPLGWSQESKIIEIQKAGGSSQDEEKFPGANILFKDKQNRVHLFHEGALVVSDRAYFYGKSNFFKAEGTVVFTQGDSLRMTCDYIEYDGNSKKAKAWGNVFLKRPDTTLRTDTLYLNRAEKRAFYNTKGVIVDSTSTLTSNKGTYFMDQKKYRFVSEVNIVNPDYTVNSQQLDYYTESHHAYLYGQSRIVGETYEILCEQGFYDLNVEKGYFKKNAVIFYDQKIIEGDSLYFENNKQYAAASRNISILDSLNNSLIKGHYGEIFKAKDSAIITQQALAINLIENDSLFIHADTLMATGVPEKKVLRGFYDVRIFKSDLKGRADSIYIDQAIGLTKLHHRPLTEQEEQVFTEADRNQKNPVLWFDESQMTGNEIYLISNKETNALDSLKIRGNAYIIEKDSLSTEGYNQIQGGLLDGVFKEGRLDNIVVTKNTQMIYYLYNDEDLALIGIDKTTCSAMKMQFENGEIGDITFLVAPEGDVFPEEDIPENERTLKGFIWRKEERPESVEDLFREEEKRTPNQPLPNDPKKVEEEKATL
jgi:lipopolysaccharide export system protein LptA